MLGCGRDICKDKLWVTVESAQDASWEGSSSAGTNMRKSGKWQVAEGHGGGWERRDHGILHTWEGWCLKAAGECWPTESASTEGRKTLTPISSPQSRLQIYSWCVYGGGGAGEREWFSASQRNKTFSYLTLSLGPCATTTHVQSDIQQP